MNQDRGKQLPKTSKPRPRRIIAARLRDVVSRHPFHIRKQTDADNDQLGVADLTGRQNSDFVQVIASGQLTDGAADDMMQKHRVVVADPSTGTWTVNVCHSKTDQNAVGQQVALPAFSGPLCPTTALRSWLAAADIMDGPVFRVVDKRGRLTSKPLAPQSLGIILRGRAATAGLPRKQLSAHSLRSGFAISAVRAGLSLPLIRAVTRHTTSADLAPYVCTAGPPTVVQMEGLVLCGKACRDWAFSGAAKAGEAVRTGSNTRPIRRRAAQSRIGRVTRSSAPAAVRCRGRVVGITLCWKLFWCDQDGGAQACRPNPGTRGSSTDGVGGEQRAC